ncbi:MAG: hypothetical protein MUD13_07235 [Candidatus Nanopelagicales bacterium]|nr:hypothetical protein [Candidatus Nanopelagicales bacterium]
MAVDVEARPGRPRVRAVGVVAVVVIAAGLIGIGIVKMAGQAAFDKAVALGQAMQAEPESLYDKARIAEKADSLGARVSFPPQFAENGVVVVHSWLPMASACLSLPASGAWGFGVGDEPCDPAMVSREGPQAIAADQRAAMGISQPESWADEENPLIAVGRDAQATGYGDVYVINEGPDEGVAVSVMGFTKVTGEPGRKAYFEASAAVRCQPIEGCQWRDYAMAKSWRNPSRTFTPASALIRLPGDTTSVRVAVRQCLDLRFHQGNDVCTGWNYVGPIEVPAWPHEDSDG